MPETSRDMTHIMSVITNWQSKAQELADETRHDPDGAVHTAVVVAYQRVLDLLGSADNSDSVKLDRHEREARAFAGFVETQGHSLAEILGRRGPEDLVLTRDRFSPETLAELAMIAFPDDDEPDTGSVTSATVKTWTYSQVNPGGADVTHGFTFTGTDDEWAEHLVDLTYQGIEPFNAKITAP